MPIDMDRYIQFIPFNVTEESAATMTEQEIALFANFLTNQGIEIHGIVCEQSLPADNVAANSTESISIAITTQPFATMPNIDEDYVIWKHRLDISCGQSTNEFSNFKHVRAYPAYTVFRDPILVVAQKIYVYIQSTNASAAAGTKGRIHVKWVNLTKDIWQEAYQVWAPTD